MAIFEQKFAQLLRFAYSKHIVHTFGPQLIEVNVLAYPLPKYLLAVAS